MWGHCCVSKCLSMYLLSLFWGFGSGHEKKLMTCPWWKHWVCGWVGNLTQVCSKLSYSFKNWDLFCMEGGAGVSFAYHPDHFSTELAFLITCPPSLFEYVLDIWPLSTYSNSLRWLSQGVQSPALYSGRIPLVSVMLAQEQGQQLLPRLNCGLSDKAQIFFPYLPLDALKALGEFCFQWGQEQNPGKR